MCSGTEDANLGTQGVSPLSQSVSLSSILHIPPLSSLDVGEEAVAGNDVWQCCWMGLALRQSLALVAVPGPGELQSRFPGVDWLSQPGQQTGFFKGDSKNCHCFQLPLNLPLLRAPAFLSFFWFFWAVFAWGDFLSPSSVRNCFLLQKIYCLLAIPVDLGSLGHWLCNGWCLRVLLILRRTTKCSRWLSQGIELICREDGSAAARALAHSISHHMLFGKCGSLIVAGGGLTALESSLAGKYNLSSLHFSAKPYSLAEFVHVWLVPLTLMARIIKFSHYPTPHCILLCFSFSSKPLRNSMCCFDQGQTHANWHWRAQAPLLMAIRPSKKQG